MNPAAGPEQSLKMTRIIWAAMLLGQVTFLMVALAIGSSFAGSDPQSGPLLLYLATGMLVVAVPTAYIIRSVIYRARASGSVVSPQQYFTANLVFLAMLEGVGLFAIVGLLISGDVGLHLLVVAAALGLQALNFPTGSAMREENAIEPMHRRSRP
jgi:F0F1-type ATP synthase membrane subunit c/vacuolar-type H+-ATPase subunit K